MSKIRGYLTAALGAGAFISALLAIWVGGNQWFPTSGVLFAAMFAVAMYPEE